MDRKLLRTNLESVQTKIAQAARRSGRDPSSVTLVAVTKRTPTDWVAPLAEMGARDLGENYPQELWAKAEATAGLPLRWHLIGHLQGNKARKTLPVVRMIHAVDSLKLLQTLDTLAAELALAEPPTVCLQVNTSGEPAKHGWSARAILDDAEAISACRKIPVVGLMTMAAYGTDAETARPSFVLLRQTRDDLTRAHGFAARASLDGDVQRLRDRDRRRGDARSRRLRALRGGRPLIVLTPHANGTVLRVRAQPGAKRNAVLGERAGALRVAVSAAPEKGKANDAIQAVLADALGCRSSQIALLSGATSRSKTFLVSGIEPDELRMKVDASSDRCHDERTSRLSSETSRTVAGDATMTQYPAELTPSRWTASPLNARVRVPGSKSLTNRALIVAAQAKGRSTLTGALDSDDTRVMVDSLQRLGIGVNHTPETATIDVEGCGGQIPASEADLYVANSGTSLRFLTALAATGRGTYRLDGNPRMRQRPVADLLQALNGLGADCKSDLGTGCPPVTVKTGGLDGGYAFVKGDVSSQFLSALLMVLPNSNEPTTVEIDGPLVSLPYVAMTLAVMEAFGVRIGNRKFRRFDVRPAHYKGRTYAIEPDASAASYFFALAAISGGTITVEGLGSNSIQGDMGFVDILEHMGCQVERSADSTTVTGGPLRGVDVDMNAISDTVMTLGVVALFASGFTRIRNVAHIRHKETDRITALATELRKLGATVDEQPDGLLIIPPAQLTPARIATYDDHRVAMAFALAAVKTGGVTIEDPGCVAKTYPGFWDDLSRLTPAS